MNTQEAEIGALLNGIDFKDVLDTTYSKKATKNGGKAASQQGQRKPSTDLALKQQKVEFASRYLRDPFAESVVDLSLYISALQCITENRDIPLKALAWEVGVSEVQAVCILRKARREKRRHAEYFHEALDLWGCVDAEVTVRLKKFKADSHASLDEGAVGTLLGRAVEAWTGGRAAGTSSGATSDVSTSKVLSKSKKANDSSRKSVVRCVVDFGRTIITNNAAKSTSERPGADVDTSRVLYLDERQLELTEESKKKLRPELPTPASPAGAAQRSEEQAVLGTIEDVDPDFSLFLRVWRAGPELNLKQIAAAAGVSFGKAQRLLRKAKQLDEESQKPHGSSSSSIMSKTKTKTKNAPDDDATEEGCEDEHLKKQYWPFHVEPDLPKLIEYEEPLRVDAMHFANLSERFRVHEVRTKRTGTDPRKQKVWMEKATKSAETVCTTPNGIQTYFTPIGDEGSADNAEDDDLGHAGATTSQMNKKPSKTIVLAPGNLEKPVVAGASLKKSSKGSPNRIEWVPADSMSSKSIDVYMLFGHPKTLLESPLTRAKGDVEKLFNACAKMEHTIFDSFMHDRLTDTKNIRMSLVRPVRIMSTGRLPPGFENFRNFFEAGGKANYTVERKQGVNAQGQSVTNWVFVRKDCVSEEEKQNLIASGVMDALAAATPNPGDFASVNLDRDALAEWTSTVLTSIRDEEKECTTTTTSTSQSSNMLKATSIPLAADHDGISAPYTRYDAYQETEAATQRGLQERLAREEKRRNENRPAKIEIGPDGEAVTLPAGVTSFFKANLDEDGRVPKGTKAAGAGDACNYRDFAEEHIEVSYSLPPEAGASAADFAFERFFWRCIEDDRVDLTSGEAACSLLLEMGADENGGSAACSSQDVLDELSLCAESGELTDEDAALVIPWIRDPSILEEQKQRAEEIRRMWNRSCATAAGAEAVSVVSDVNPKKASSKKSGPQFQPDSRIAGTDEGALVGVEDKMKKRLLQLHEGHEDGFFDVNEEPPAARVVAKFLKKRMKFRHTMRGINELRRQGLLNVDKTDTRGNNASVKLRATVRGNVQKTGTEIMKTLKRIAYVAGGGSSRVDSPASGVAGGAVEGLTPLSGEKLAQMLTDGDA
eukprot:g8370.t1